MDYGHWKTLKEVDVKNYIGFVYVIEFSNGSRYIGAKKIWKNIKVPPSTFKKKKEFFESDWKTYTSSSKEVNDNIADGNIPINYIIVGFYKTWGSTLFGEAIMQLHNNVLGSDEWLNKHIEGHFTKSCLDENIAKDVRNWKEYVKGNIEPVYLPSSEVLYDAVAGEDIYIDNKYQFCSVNSVNPSTLERLLSGDIDNIDERWMIRKELQRSVVMFTKGDKAYNSRKEILEGEGLDVKEFNTLVKDGVIKKHQVEDRKAFKQRLQNVKEYV